jgi:hypothetical protein
MVPPAPAGIVGRSGPGPGCLCALLRPLTLNMVEDGLVASGSPFWIQAPEIGQSTYAALGPAVVLFASIGLWMTINQVGRRAKVLLDWAALAKLAVATFAPHCIIPTGSEGRYVMILLLPSIFLFSAAGVDGIAHRLGASRPLRSRTISTPAIRLDLLRALMVRSELR